MNKVYPKMPVLKENSLFSTPKTEELSFPKIKELLLTLKNQILTEEGDQNLYKRFF